MDLGFPLMVAGVVVVAVVVLIGIFVVLRSYRIAAPSEALIITGKGASSGDAAEGGRVVIGGRAVVYPIVQKAFVLSLSSRQISVEIDGYSKNGIALRLRGVAQVKVGGTVEDVRKAAQRFLDQQEQIDHYSQEILSGTLRAVVGTLTVEQIIQDRASFAAQVQEESAHSMNNQGLVIDTFQISAVEDDGSYLRDWGRPQAAQVAKNAAIAEANAQREAAVASALQNEETQKQQALTDQAIAEQQQTLAIRRAELKEESDVRQAVADNAGPLSAAAERRRLLEVERVAAKEQAELRAEQLVAEVERPADAEKYRRQAAADAEAYEIDRRGQAEADAELHRRNRAAEALRIEGEAQAAAELARRAKDAEAVRLAGEAEAAARKAKGLADAAAEYELRSKLAEATRLEGEAEADAIRARGEAEAAAAKARGEAEAFALEQKAEAYRHFTDAAVLDQVLSTLPALAGKLVEPYSNIKDLSIVSTDGESKLAQSMSSNLSSVLEVLRGTTGVDLAGMVKKATGQGPDSAEGAWKSSDDRTSDGSASDIADTLSDIARRFTEGSDAPLSEDSGSTGSAHDFAAGLGAFGDEVKRSTGIDVNALIDEALRARGTRGRHTDGDTVPGEATEKPSEDTGADEDPEDPAQE
ncbi:flotillin family protein [Brevibacterium samyangense]|uniref:Flotillin family protein n=1 Tax=Brevibacterium samyangense TaxID=366888 RepID=A0ABP5EP61_9MICO